MIPFSSRTREEQPGTGLIGWSGRIGVQGKAKTGSWEKEYFVGKLAEEESSTASFAFEENKIAHPHMRVLLATAAKLLAGRDKRAERSFYKSAPLLYFVRRDFRGY